MTKDDLQVVTQLTCFVGHPVASFLMEESFLHFLSFKITKCIKRLIKTPNNPFFLFLNRYCICLYFEFLAFSGAGNTAEEANL